MPAGDRYASILFDLDGTLTNPKLGITRSVQYALGRLGITAENLDELEVYIGPPLRQSFQRFHRLTEQESKQALAHYREYFEREGMFENVEYPGIRDLLRGLRAAGKALFVATSKPRVYAQRILAHFGLEGFFEAIEGSELDETRSDKAELVAYVLGKHRLRRPETIMVGDRMHDIAAASRNGISSIGVLYGFGSREELQGADATWCIGTPAELAEFFLPRSLPRPDITPCGLDDLEILRAVSRETYEETFGGMTSGQTMSAYLAEAFSAEKLRSELANPRCRFFLLRVDGAVAGYLKLNEAPGQSDRNDPDSLEIERIYVRSEHQHRGLGKVLVDYSVQAARKLGKRYLWLGVWERNTNAISFYEKMGFSAAGRHPFRMRDELQSDLVMKRVLS